jgi:predicted transcriptional regulator of viral defense system
VASQLVTPSYISFWSALHFHGLIEQAPRIVFVAVTRQKRSLTFQGMAFQFVRLLPHMFFGYRRETLAGLPLTVADEAKAILDSLYLPDNAGGLTEVAKSLRAALLDGRVEVAQLVEYARRMRNASLAGRLGYLLERLGQPAVHLPSPRGPVALDPARPRAGEYDRRWKVYVNVSDKELFPEGVG